MTWISILKCSCNAFYTIVIWTNTLTWQTTTTSNCLVIGCWIENWLICVSVTIYLMCILFCVLHSVSFLGKLSLYRLYTTSSCQDKGKWCQMHGCQTNTMRVNLIQFVPSTFDVICIVFSQHELSHHQTGVINLYVSFQYKTKIVFGSFLTFTHIQQRNWLAKRRI